MLKKMAAHEEKKDDCLSYYWVSMLHERKIFFPVEKEGTENINYLELIVAMDSGDFPNFLSTYQKLFGARSNPKTNFRVKLFLVISEFLCFFQKDTMADKYILWQHIAKTYIEERKEGHVSDLLFRYFIKINADSECVFHVGDWCLYFIFGLSPEDSAVKHETIEEQMNFALQRSFTHIAEKLDATYISTFSDLSICMYAVMMYFKLFDLEKKSTLTDPKLIADMFFKQGILYYQKTCQFLNKEQLDYGLGGDDKEKDIKTCIDRYLGVMDHNKDALFQDIAAVINVSNFEILHENADDEKKLKLETVRDQVVPRQGWLIAKLREIYAQNTDDKPPVYTSVEHLVTFIQKRYLSDVSAISPTKLFLELCNDDLFISMAFYITNVIARTEAFEYFIVHESLWTAHTFFKQVIQAYNDKTSSASSS